MIYSGEFAPDAKISIENVARALGVSRTPVRDAFAQLEREGLVNISSRVGVFVRRRPVPRRPTSTRSSSR